MMSSVEKQLDSNQFIGLFTNKERVILKFVALGCSNRDIAVKTEIAVDTVKWHLKNIYEKLYVSRRTEAVAKVLSLNVG